MYAEGVLERLVQHRRPDVKERLHGGQGSLTLYIADRMERWAS